MVINYKRLNDNTIEDAYKIPGKDSLINRIQNSTYFSKLDLKSGFWQIKMHPDSVKYTAFTIPNGGHYEWLVMPFGLKNAPAEFQKMMDKIFGKYYKFVAVYIDDILVFSKNKREHINHLQIVFSEIERHGLIISKKKMELFKYNIKFLGSEIGKGTIKLQAHISQKILDMPDKLEDLKLLQTFLGLVNYARPFIKNLSKYTGPLYSKTSIKGQRYFNTSDIKLVQEIKALVKTLPELKLPLDTDYLIIEVDGCEKGWGAVLLRKPEKFSPKDLEEVCRYSSGKYTVKTTSSLDYEILAVINALQSFHLYLLNKQEIVTRTDCEAIVKYFKTEKENNKRVMSRWIDFKNEIINTGIKVIFEHIAGKKNQFADFLSRISTYM